MRTNLIFTAAAAVALVITGSGCGSSASGTVKMENKTGQALMLQAQALTSGTRTAPDYLGAKIIAIYLGSEKTEGGHVPSATTLWFHPDCLVPAGEGDGSVTKDGSKEAHIARCGLEKGGTASNTEHSLVDKQVRTYIDLARPTAEVNAQLAAEALEIRTGTYKYVVVAMNDPGNAAEGVQEDEDGTHAIGTVPSIKFWNIAGMGAPLLSTGKPPAEAPRFKKQQSWVSELPEALVVGDGDSVQFTLSYDLSQAYWTGDTCADNAEATSFDCQPQTGTVNGKKHFIQFPNLAVTVSKN